MVHLRTGVVLSSHGGALGRLLPLIKLGVGGRFGDGRQFWPWISLTDEVRAIEHLLTSEVHGPVNLVTAADRNAEVVGALAQALHRPAVVPVPAFALRAVLGDFSSEVLGSNRAVPGVLEADGFVPRTPTWGPPPGGSRRAADPSPGGSVTSQTRHPSSVQRSPQHHRPGRRDAGRSSTSRPSRRRRWSTLGCRVGDQPRVPDVDGQPDACAPGRPRPAARRRRRAPVRRRSRRRRAGRVRGADGGRAEPAQLYGGGDRVVRVA